MDRDLFDNPNLRDINVTPGMDFEEYDLPEIDVDLADTVRETGWLAQKGEALAAGFITGKDYALSYSIGQKLKHWGLGMFDQYDMHNAGELKERFGLDVEPGTTMNTLQAYYAKENKIQREENARRSARFMSLDQPMNMLFAFTGMMAGNMIDPLAHLSGHAVGAVHRGGSALLNTMRVNEKLWRWSNRVRPIATKNDFISADTALKISNHLRDKGLALPNNIYVRLAEGGAGNLLEELGVQATQASIGYKYELTPLEYGMNIFMPAIFHGIGVVAKGAKRVGVDLSRQYVFPRKPEALTPEYYKDLSLENRSVGAAETKTGLTNEQRLAEKAKQDKLREEVNKIHAVSEVYSASSRDWYTRPDSNGIIRATNKNGEAVILNPAFKALPALLKRAGFTEFETNIKAADRLKAEEDALVARFQEDDITTLDTDKLTKLLGDEEAAERLIRKSGVDGEVDVDTAIAARREVKRSNTADVERHYTLPKAGSSENWQLAWETAVQAMQKSVEDFSHSGGAKIQTFIRRPVLQRLKDLRTMIGAGDTPTKSATQVRNERYIKTAEHRFIKSMLYGDSRKQLKVWDEPARLFKFMGEEISIPAQRFEAMHDRGLARMLSHMSPEDYRTMTAPDGEAAKSALSFVKEAFKSKVKGKRDSKVIQEKALELRKEQDSAIDKALGAMAEAVKAGKKPKASDTKLLKGITGLKTTVAGSLKDRLNTPLKDRLQKVSDVNKNYILDSIDAGSVNTFRNAVVIKGLDNPTLKDLPESLRNENGKQLLKIHKEGKRLSKEILAAVKGKSRKEINDSITDVARKLGLYWYRPQDETFVNAVSTFLIRVDAEARADKLADKDGKIKALKATAEKKPHTEEVVDHLRGQQYVSKDSAKPVERKTGELNVEVVLKDRPKLKTEAGFEAALVKFKEETGMVRDFNAKEKALTWNSDAIKKMVKSELLPTTKQVEWTVRAAYELKDPSKLNLNFVKTRGGMPLHHVEGVLADMRKTKVPVEEINESGIFKSPEVKPYSRVAQHANRIIAQIPDPIERTVLRSKYRVDGTSDLSYNKKTKTTTARPRSLEAIAKDTGLSVASVRRYLTKAEAHLEMIKAGGRADIEPLRNMELLNRTVKTRDAEVDMYIRAVKNNQFTADSVLHTIRSEAANLAHRTRTPGTTGIRQYIDHYRHVLNRFIDSDERFGYYRGERNELDAIDTLIGHFGERRVDNWMKDLRYSLFQIGADDMSVTTIAPFLKDSVALGKHLEEIMARKGVKRIKDLNFWDVWEMKSPKAIMDAVGKAAISRLKRFRKTEDAFGDSPAQKSMTDLEHLEVHNPEMAKALKEGRENVLKCMRGEEVKPSELPFNKRHLAEKREHGTNYKEEIKDVRPTYTKEQTEADMKKLKNIKGVTSTPASKTFVGVSNKAKKIPVGPVEHEGRIYNSYEDYIREHGTGLSGKQIRELGLKVGGTTEGKGNRDILEVAAERGERGATQGAQTQFTEALRVAEGRTVTTEYNTDTRGGGVRDAEGKLVRRIEDQRGKVLTQAGGLVTPIKPAGKKAPVTPKWKSENDFQRVGGAYLDDGYGWAMPGVKYPDIVSRVDNTPTLKPKEGKEFAEHSKSGLSYPPRKAGKEQKGWKQEMQDLIDKYKIPKEDADEAFKKRVAARKEARDRRDK